MTGDRFDDLALAREVAAELEGDEPWDADACPQCRGTSSHKLGCTDPAAVRWRAEQARAARGDERPL